MTNLDKTQTKPIRATLHHFDGTTSQIELNAPRYSFLSDYEETACMMQKEYCNILAAYWVKIYKFVIETGDINAAGEFESAAKYKDYEIPKGKVFVRGKFGQWIDYATAYQTDFEAQCIALENVGALNEINLKIGLFKFNNSDVLMQKRLF